ncbi:MAG: ATP-binding protein [Chloroflexota bacterium]|nr:ATP-binding protein [Chloroflexota bacterium]
MTGTNAYRGPGKRWDRSSLLAYTIAIATTLLAAAMKVAIPDLGPAVPFLLFSSAIAVTAGFGGPGPGILATAMSVVLAHFLFLTSSGGFAPTTSVLLQEAAFLFEGALITAISGSLHSARGKAAYAAARAEQAGAEAAQERDQLQQIVEVLPEGVAIVDSSGRTILKNHVAEAIRGPLPDDALTGGSGERGPRTIEGAGLSPDLLPVARSLRGDVVHGEQQLAREIHSGRDIALLVSSAPLRGTDESIIGAVTVFQDISAIKDLERERIDFFAMASHEIKTPITTIRGQVQLALRRAQRGRPTAEILESLHRADEQTSRMISLIEELLDLSRLQTAQLDIRLVRVDLVSAIREAVARIAPTSEQHEVRARLAGTPIWVQADTRRLDQVFDNLLTNALKYSPAGGIVEVSAGVDGDRAVVRVRDSGIGVPAGDASRLFEAFYRAQNAAPLGGTGLGLHISREIMRRHRGSLSLEETSPRGSTFVASLPLAAAETEAA